MQDAMKELSALLDYLIGHNRDHADEIIDLAKKARTLGKILVYDDLMRGVEAMKISNEHLECALKGLEDK
jgi:hypothetical protein